MMNEYSWQKAYHAAILETDHSKLQMLVWQAEIDLYERLNDGIEMNAEEAFAIAQTSNALSVLAKERLGKNLYFAKGNSG